MDWTSVRRKYRTSTLSTRPTIDSSTMTSDCKGLHSFHIAVVLLHLITTLAQFHCSTMTVTIKKAGEAVASKVIQSGKNAAKKASAMEVKPPHAVNKAEAPHMIPAKQSTKTTMMPWSGWVNRFLKDKLPENQYTTLRNTFYFMPEGKYDVMEQMPSPSTKIPYSQDGQEAGFREVAPGSQGAVDIPLHDLDDDPYDSAYFKRDTRRRYTDPEFPHPDIEQIKLDMQDPNDPEVQEAKKKLAAGPPSSPGNGGNFPTGPSDFDPSGLRAVMSVTNAEIEKHLDSHMPDHVSIFRALERANLESSRLFS